MEKPAGFQKALEWFKSPTGRPRFSWFSYPCTKLTNLQNRTPRTGQQMLNHEREVLRTLQCVGRTSELAIETVRNHGDFAWEWPKSAYRGWNSKQMAKLWHEVHKLGKKIYVVDFDGCAFGHWADWGLLKAEKVMGSGLIQKPWRVWTTSVHVAESATTLSRRTRPYRVLR